MALMSAQRSSSFKPSSSETPPRRYDVFLSFRGVDIRDNFLEYLHRALCQKAILTFKDDDKLEDGETIKDGLLEAIEESRFSIVVLSKNYADSSWCLKELVRILECKRTTGQIVYPVFYHVEPSEVRKKEGAFGEGFARALLKKEEKTSSEKEEVEAEVTRWTEALEEVGNLKGWVYPDAKFSTEANLIDDLVHNVFHKSIDTNHIFNEDLVGITSRRVQVIELLDLGSDETRVVGLWGMGGIGKTTLATTVYDLIKCYFEGCSFIDVTQVLNEGGVSALQEHFISDILGEDIKVRSAIHGLSIIQNIVCRKKVLIVLDNVSTPKQVEDLVRKLQYFNYGSRIIITTRDKHVLTVCGVRHVFNVQELNEDEAIQLFESKAFVENGKTEEFQRLIDRAVGYAKGVPLALEVFGSVLLGETVTVWESALDRFRESPGDDVEKVLKISYDGLHWTEKEIFLDIACFFKGKRKDRVINILDSCGFNAIIGIHVLVKKSLLAISTNNKVVMHDLVQKMGWSIVDFDGDGRRIKPGERSRLWRPCDVKHVLTENTGTEKVQGIFLSSSENIQLRPDAFAKMTNLRILHIDGASCSVDLPYKVRILQWIFGDRHSIDLPNKLCYLHWNRYPFKRMPFTFQPEHLVELRLTNSCIGQLWDGIMVLPKLQVLDLSQSWSLTKSPEFTGFPNLETLAFEGCRALVDLHPSIGKMKKLKQLNFRDCSSLQTLPYGTESQCIEVLVFSGCLKLNNIFENFGDLKQLSELDLDWTGITKLPQSIGNATNLISLDFSGCEKLESIPSSIGHLKNLETLDFTGCRKLVSIPNSIGQLEKLKTLYFFGCRKLENIPRSIGQLEKLETLNCSHCEKLKSIPSGIGQLKKLEDLDLYGCYSLSELPVSLVQLRNLRNLSCTPSTSQISNFMPLELLSFPVFESLTELRIRNSRLTSFPESVCLCVSLKYLHLHQSDFESLPTSIKYLSNLETLQVTNCKRLQELPELPPNVVRIWVEGCDSLKTIGSLIVYRDAESLVFSGCPKLVGNEEIKVLLGYKFLSDHIKEIYSRLEYRGPDSKIPEWFSYQNVGASITFNLPILDSSTFNLLGFALSAVVATKHKYCIIYVRIQTRGKILSVGSYLFPRSDVEHAIIFYYPIKFHLTTDELIQMSGTVSQVYFDVRCKTVPVILECGVHPFYKDEVGSNGKINQGSTKKRKREEVGSSEKINQPLRLME